MCVWLWEEEGGEEETEKRASRVRRSVEQLNNSR
jgi:hypothetical protein